jgi:hypothetical protein
VRVKNSVQLNNTNQFITISINGFEVYNQLILNNTIETIVITNETIIYQNHSLITGNLTLNPVTEEKPFYILCLFTSLIALGIIYKRLR